MVPCCSVSHNDDDRDIITMHHHLWAVGLKTVISSGGGGVAGC